MKKVAIFLLLHLSIACSYKTRGNLEGEGIKRFDSSILDYEDLLAVDLAEFKYNSPEEKDYFYGMKALVELVKDSTHVLNYPQDKIDSLGTFMLMSKAIYLDFSGQIELADKYFIKAFNRNNSSINKWLPYEYYQFRQDHFNEYQKNLLEQSLSSSRNFLPPLIEHFYLPDSIYPLEKKKELFQKEKLNEINKAYVQNLYGDLLFNEGKYAEAISVYKKAIQIKDNVQSYLGIGDSYNSINTTNSIKKALEFYRKAYELDSISSEIAIRYAWALFDNNHQLESQKTFQALIQNQPSKKNYEEIFTFFIQTGQPEMLKNYVDESLEINGENNSNLAFNAFYFKLMKDKAQNVSLLQKLYQEKNLEAIELYDYLVDRYWYLR